MITQHTLKISTPGRSLINITSQIANLISTPIGLCNIFLHHTSASLILNENADISVQTDLESFMQRLIPDGDSLFTHIAEGPDDMPSHIRTILTQNSLTIPITQGKLNLGTWQGIYLWEHRINPHERKMTVTIQN